MGKAESQALFNLMKKVPAPVVSALRDAVRMRGMRPFLMHETISKDLFSDAFSSGINSMGAWEGPLTNKGGDENDLVLCQILGVRPVLCTAVRT